MAFLSGMGLGFRGGELMTYQFDTLVCFQIFIIYMSEQTIIE